MTNPVIIDLEWCERHNRLLDFGVMDSEGHVLPVVDVYLPGPQDNVADPTITTVAHTKADWRWLVLHGYEVAGPLHDTQVMAWILNENMPLDLAYLAKRYLGIVMDKRIKQIGGDTKFKTDGGQYVHICDAPEDQRRAYNIRDLETERQLYFELLRRLEQTGWKSYWEKEEVPFTSVLVDMEDAGLPVDLGAATEMTVELEERRARLDNELHVEGFLPRNFNIGSGDQLAAYLFSKRFELKDSVPITPEERTLLKEEGDESFLPITFTPEKVGRTYVHGVHNLKGRGLKKTPKSEKKDRPSTSTPNLLVKHPDDEWVQKLIEWRRTNKVLTTYLRPLPERVKDGRIHGSFNQTGTKTGRLSSSGPNLQNIPAHGELGPRVRAIFRGDLVVGDYSQLEPRLMAHFSGDPVLLDTYRTGKDIYLVTAEGIFGRKVEKHEPERQICKTLVLALGYGAGPRKLAQILSINGYATDTATAKGYLNELEVLYSEFFEWKRGVIDLAHQKGYITTLSGRYRRLRKQFDQPWNHKLVGYGERQAVNAIIQGTAADIVRRAMLRSNVLPNWRLLAQVHDELLWEHDREYGGADLVAQAGLIREICESRHGFDLNIPLEFEIKYVESWAEKETAKPVMLELEEAT